MQFSKINPLCTLRFPEINKIAYLCRIHKKVIHIIHRKDFTFLVFSQHIPTLYTFYPHVVFFVLPLYLAIFSQFFPESPPKCRSRPNLSTKLSTLSTFSYHFTYTQDIPRLSTILSTNGGWLGWAPPAFFRTRRRLSRGAILRTKHLYFSLQICYHKVPKQVSEPMCTGVPLFAQARRPRGLSAFPAHPHIKRVKTMDKITLKNTLHHTTTILPNEFIDHYMIRADGEYVKIYLLILRLMNQNLPVEIDQLADTLELTRKDILRALKYWEKEGLLAMEDETAQTDAKSGGQAADGIPGSGQASAGGSDSYPTLPQEGHRSGTDALYGGDLFRPPSVCFGAEQFLLYHGFPAVFIGASGVPHRILHQPGQKERPLHGERGHQLVPAGYRYDPESKSRIQPVYTERISDHEGVRHCQPESGTCGA